MFHCVTCKGRTELSKSGFALVCIAKFLSKTSVVESPAGSVTLVHTVGSVHCIAVSVDGVSLVCAVSEPFVAKDALEKPRSTSHMPRSGF